MSDVLMYNALKEYFVLNKRYVENLVNRTTGFPIVRGPDAFTSNTANGWACTCGVTQASTAVTFPSFWANTFTDSWSSIPMLTTATCGFKVCDTSGLFRCGACCLWTVPGGVTRAQFQIWGPGGGTSTSCCCGGAPFGPSGAYATVIMNVSAGQQFTLCAGCAVCCYSCACNPGIQGGCPSFVTGPNINLFCAQGGTPDVVAWMRDVGHCQAFSGVCRFPTCLCCGPESCYCGWMFCFDSCTDGGVVYFAFSSNARFFGNVTGATVYGLNGMWPLMRLDNTASCFGGTSNNYTVAAPVFGFVEQSQCLELFCCAPGGWIRTGNSRGFLAGSGRMPIPGQGGYATQVFAGGGGSCCDSICCFGAGGDAGRMGMVCVRMC